MRQQTVVPKSLEEVHGSVDTTDRTGWVKSLFAFVGPAYLVSVGYMDPGNWATDIAAGSAFGYKLIWVLMMSNLMALLLQSHCARLGIVRRRDLAQASKEIYPPIINIPLYLLAEIAIAACDLAEVLGLAIGLNLLFHLPLLAGISIALFDALLLLLIMQWGIRKMEAFIISMVFIMGASFFIEIFIAKPDAASILTGFLPSIPNNTALYITIGIIGATVMPHNLYLHSALVQTRKIDHHEAGQRKAIRFNFIDSFIALNLAFFVNASILILAAAVFFKNGLFEIADIQDAHQLMAPLMGTKLAPILFAVALIASGQSSTITGTLAGQIVMEGYLNLRIAPWLRRLITRLLAVVPAFLVIFFYGDEKTGELLILSQVILSLQLGFAVVPLIHFVSNKEKMGKHAIGPVSKTLSWITAAVIISLNIKLVVDEIASWLESAGDYRIWIYVIVIPIVLLACVLLLYITFRPLFVKKKYTLPRLHVENLPMDFQLKSEFRKIAVTLDFSEKDHDTLARALTTGGNNASYLLIHIVESAGAMLIGKEIADLESNEDLMVLKEYAQALELQGFQIHYELGYGRRSKVIPELVKRFHADLLVMGAHGHRALKDTIFGETINAVRHKIDIPLLAVK
ncbi:MAG: Nramp family divalent metal transporter [Chitinophagales bacterium]|nr:Nramp family divalent metal transporter [Chitinophagales bacterium]